MAPAPEVVNRLHLVHLVDDLRGPAPSDSEHPHPIFGVDASEPRGSPESAPVKPGGNAELG